MSLRIALLTYSTKPRGGVIHTLELAEALHAQGHQVCVYALSKEGAGFDRDLACDQILVPAPPVSGGIDVVIRQRIQDYLEHFWVSPLTYDCYHAQDCISANALGLLRQEGKIPHYVRTVHHIEAYSSPYLQECQDRSIREPDLCLCVSHLWQTELQRLYGIHAPRVTNGVDLARFSPLLDGTEAALKSKWDCFGSPLFLTVGGIEPRKNSLRLLQAFQAVLADYPQAQLIIAGGETLFDYQEYRNQFWQLVRDYGLTLGKELIVTGTILSSEMPALYRLATAFVFPSVKEGWGLVVLEAIAAGIPVVTSDQAPFTEFLTAEQALLVDPESPLAIATAMKTVLDPTIAAGLVAASQSVLPRYDWATSARVHTQHYYDLLSARHS